MMEMVNDTGLHLDFPELTFKDESHTYRLDGEVIPSVSTIMEPLKVFHYQGISERTMTKAAAKGTSVHNSIENWIKFDFEDVAPEHRGFFDGFLAWTEEEAPKIIGSELRVYHPILRYAGTIDILWFDKDGHLTITDVKTTSQLIDMLCGVQLEAYGKALDSHGIKIQRKNILHLKRDGRYEVREFPANDAERWRVFGSLKCVYDYVQSYK